MAYCADSFSRSFSHTFRLLFQPFRLFYWIKVSILAFFIQGFSVLSTQSYFHELPNPNELDRLAEEALAVLPTIVGVLIASMFIGIIMHALQACARFMFFDAVREGFISYRSSMQRHFSGIVSLFLWNVIIKIVFFTCMIIAVLVLLIPNVLLASTANNMIGMAVAFTIDAVFALFVLLIVVAHSMILNGIVVPQMVVQSKGILESWGNSFRIIRENFGEFFGYLLVRVAISLAHMFIVFIIIFTITLFSFGYYTVTSSPDSFNLSAGIDPFSSFQWLQIPIQFLVTFLLIPIPILKDAYALCFLKDVQGDERFEPIGGKPVEPGSSSEPVWPPVPNGDLNGEGYETKNETDLFRGPVSFKDIPNVDTTGDSTSEPKSDFDEKSRPPDIAP